MLALTFGIFSARQKTDVMLYVLRGERVAVRALGDVGAGVKPILNRDARRYVDNATDRLPHSSSRDG